MLLQPGNHRDVHQDPRLEKGDVANGDWHQESFAGQVLDKENVITWNNGKQTTEICLNSKLVLDALHEQELWP